MNLEETVSLISQLEDYKKFNKLEFYVPYDFQKEFHFAKGHGEFVHAPSDKNGDGLALVRALMCANQIGKTTCGAMELAFHLTGLYPEPGQYFYPEYWHGTDPPAPCEYYGKDIYPNGWEGHRYTRPIKAIVGSNTNETARDICQKELFGAPEDDKLLGTGSVPKSRIKKTNRKPGVTNAFDSVLVEHNTGGNSVVYFRAYEQGKKKFMGIKFDYAWPDEEPPQEIQSQIRRSQLSTNGVEAITFTPEDGITKVVHGFIHEIKPGQSLIRASWDDAPHMTPERREQKLLDYPEHEREMRSEGNPTVGEGLIFPVSRELMEINPIEIPPHWPRINGIDFGWDHPFACAFIAWDRETDTVYVYDGYREKRTLPAVHADAIKQRGDWIPVSWPKDGLQHDKGSGTPLSEIYRRQGLNMFSEFFTNPPRMGDEEGKGGFSVEAGILEMLEMMETGRLKVFKTVTAFWEEIGMYHRKDGKIVAMFDDFISALRYAVMFRRHAQTKVVFQPKQNIRRGSRNWR